MNVGLHKGLEVKTLSTVVPLYGLYLEPYKVIPKGNYLGAYGYNPTYYKTRM